MEASEERTITLSDRTFLRLPIGAWFFLVGILATSILAWADNLSDIRNATEAQNKFQSDLEEMSKKVESYNNLLIRIDERTSTMSKQIEKLVP